MGKPTIDLVPQLQRDKDLTLAVKDRTGEIGCLRFNQLFPPFDNPAIRRVVVSAMDQKEIMEAVAGADPSLIKTDVGIFVPGTPMASTVGVEITRGPKDYDKLKQDLIAAGYKGEKMVILAASTFPIIWAEAQVASDMLKKIGMNTDFQALEWGTVVARRASQEPIDKGGWNIFYTYLGGFGNISPAPDIADPEQRRQGKLVRLADRSENGGAAPCVVRRARCRGAKKDLRADADRVLAEPAVCAAGHVLSADRVP